MNGAFRVPAYVWVFVGMIIGAIVGWATGNYNLWVGIGTFIGAIVTAVLYAQQNRGNR